MFPKGGISGDPAWKTPFTAAEAAVCPIVLDLDGNGVQITPLGQGIFFDHNGDGFAEESAWASPTDGILVRDRNGDGQITNGNELIGDQTLMKNGKVGKNGFEVLKEYDDNLDGRIDAQDALWGQLQVWVDANADGVSQAGELHSLAAVGLKSLDLAYSQPNGTGTLATSHFTKTDGSTGNDADDPYFNVNSTNSVASQWLAVPDAIAQLPDITGHGQVYTLHQAMVRDSTLTELVQSLASSTPANRSALLEQIIFRWAGSDGVDPHSRDNKTYSTAWDARKLVALEKFVGRGFVQPNADSGKAETNPLPQSISLLNQAWSALCDEINAQFLMQGSCKPLYDSLGLSISAQGIDLDVSATVTMLQTAYAANATTGSALLTDFAFTLKTLDDFGWQAIDRLHAAGNLYGTGFDLLLATAGQTLLTGDANVNSLSGENGRDDILLGLGGNDTLYGLGGHDSLLGGDGSDYLNGGAGNDILDGGAGNDSLSGDAGADTYKFGRGSGQDTLSNYDTEALGVNADTVLLGADIATGDVTLSRVGTNLILTINGTTDKLTVNNYFGGDGTQSYAVENLRFADGTAWDIAAVKTKVMQSTSGADTLYGYATNDTLNGGDGNDILFGYAGNDALNGMVGNDSIYGGDGDDVLSGAAGNDLLYGEVGNDILQGGADNDALNGGAGNDILDGGAGNDSLSGDAGADTYKFGRGSGQDTLSNYDTEALGVNADTVLLGADIATGDVTLSRVGTNLILTINGTTDKLTVNNYFGGDGTQSYAVENLRFADGTAWDIATVKTKVMQSTSGADTLYGYATNDTLNGGDGNDILFGYAGNDALNGMVGNDSIYGGDGDDVLSGAAGNDLLYGEVGNDILQGGDGNDTLTDTSGTALFNGGAGTDAITGGAAAEIFLGGLGNDTYSTGAGNDIVLFNKGDGQDTFATGGTGSDTISLGGSGLTYADLVLTKSSNDLILKVGATDQITFKDWYAATPARPVANLQVIAEAMAGFTAGGSDPLLDQKVEKFNFAGLVGAFDAARAANSGLTSWALTNGLSSFQLAGSDTAALGGDLAYQYGKNGTLAGIGVTPALTTLSDATLGTTAQALTPIASLQVGSVRLS